MQDRYFVDNPLPFYNSYRIYDKLDHSSVISKMEFDAFKNRDAKKLAEDLCKKLNKEIKND